MGFLSSLISDPN
ncbi:hypothetical protein D031_4717A, partial [Vibrio parahaemolyticus VP-48]